ncbi:MAG: SLC13 family permease [Limnochordia bacterium]|jgi:Na+/H+ antiporter NhaD/arsenite permease-like protein|nr:SLC13 family permease [Bacillota bacterium]HPZ30345.1 SLC13 family permease [Limnochordia bacterium]
MSLKIVALILFGLTYILLLSLPKHRAYVALCSAAIFVILGIVPFKEVLSAIDWNVIMMIAGTMGIVSLFTESKMPNLLADMLIEKTATVKWAIIALSLFAGIISAFIDNVATVLMIAPVALTIASKLGISPVSSIIAISIASNLQGAATLVGDTTSILLGGHADMNFMDFFVFHGKMGLFWVVQLGALVSTVILLVVFRKEKQKIHAMERTKVTNYFPSILLVAMVLLLIIASFIPNTPKTINGIICVSLFVVGLIENVIRTKSPDMVTTAFAEIDYFTILLLCGLFVVIGGITNVGVVTDISNLFVRMSGDNLFLIYTLIVWASVLFSAFIDNIPYVATMLPVCGEIAGLMGVSPYILYFGLLVGSTLGGNLTPIGASANITGIGILRKEGYEVSAGQFMKISVPFTLAAVTTGYILVWLLWS